MDVKRRKLTISPSRKVAIVANMTALALVGNYSLVGVPNVELGTVVLFITALVFGTSMGVWCALLTSIIFATINPWGPFIPQIWITQLIGWLFVVTTGGLLGKGNQEHHRSVGPIELSFIGAFMTAVYDLVTNIGYSLAFNVPYFLAVVLGLPFMIVHVVSNAIIIALVVPIVEPILRQNLASMIWESPCTDLETHTEGKDVQYQDMR